MADEEDLPRGMTLERVPAPASAPVLVADGPMRTAGRPYIAPSPPDQLHIVWRRARKPAHLMYAAIPLLGCAGIINDGFVIAGVVMALPFLYVCAAMWFNRRRLVLTERSVTLRHEPLPWPGRKSFRIGKIEDVGVVLHEASPSVEWSLVVQTDGRARELYASDDQAEVYSLQRMLESHLGLPET